MAPKRRRSMRLRRELEAEMSPTPSEESSSSENEDDYFEVEKILGKRMVYGEIEYLVKFKGYPHSKNLWQRIDALRCDQLIREYESENQEQAPKRTRRNKRVAEFFEYEAIVDKRTTNGKPEYLVRWKNYTDDYNSWVLEEDLVDVGPIREFERVKKEGKGEAADESEAADECEPPLLIIISDDESDSGDPKPNISIDIDDEPTAAPEIQAPVEPANSLNSEVTDVSINKPAADMNEETVKNTNEEPNVSCEVQTTHEPAAPSGSVGTNVSINEPGTSQNEQPADNMSNEPMAPSEVQKLGAKMNGLNIDVLKQPKSENDIKIEKKVLFKQVQPKTEPFEGDVKIVQILDVVRTGGKGCDVICRVKTNSIPHDGWFPYEKIKQNNPQKLIEYFESCIDWPKRNSS